MSGEPLSGRIYYARLNPRARLIRVWSPAVLASAAGLVGLVTGVTGLTVICFILTVFTLWNWPLGDRTRAQMAFARTGLNLDGLGQIPWPRIASAGVRDARTGPARSVKLMIDLDRDIGEALIDDVRNYVRLAQARIWRQTRARRIVIDLDELEDPPEAVLEALKAFLPASVTLYNHRRG